MFVLYKILLVVLAISLFTFVSFFGRLPALRRTPIGWLYRLLCLHLPKRARSLDQRATGGKLTLKSQRLGQYLFYESNPVILILYIFILTGSAGLFLWKAVPILSTRLLLPLIPLLSAPYIFTYLCVAHTSHYITHSTAHPHNYPYDHTLFRPGVSCSTCHLLKPARSKHCSLCKHCVALADHHCPWVNNCLGREKFRWVILLLVALPVLQFYGAYLAYTILAPYLVTPVGPSFFSVQHLRDLGNAIVIAINTGRIPIAGVGLLAFSTAFLPAGLLAYHSYLIWAGMTTNESQKWADWRDDMADGLVFIAKLSSIRDHLSRNPDSHSVAKALGLDAEEPYVHWPVSSDQIVVRTRDGRPPTGQEGLWRQVWELGEVENIYDLGGWDNFWNVMRGA